MTPGEDKIRKDERGKILNLNPLFIFCHCTTIAVVVVVGLHPLHVHVQERAERKRERKKEREKERDCAMLNQSRAIVSNEYATFDG